MGKPLTVEKREQVRALLASGVGVNETARQTGLSSGTISNLKKSLEKDKDFEQLTAIKKKEFVDKAWEAAQKGIQIMNDKLCYIASDEELVRSTDMREISTAVGTMIDKARLASGEATQIVDGKVSLLKFEDF